MKDLKQLLKRKNVGTHAPLDEKSVFYVFQMVIKEEYGKQGLENFQAAYYRENRIFVKAFSGTLASEIWLNRGNILKMINKQIGSGEVREIVMAN